VRKREWGGRSREKPIRWPARRKKGGREGEEGTLLEEEEGENWGSEFKKVKEVRTNLIDYRRHREKTD